MNEGASARGIVSLLAWPLLLMAAAQAPAARAALPALDAARGPVGWALVGVAVIAAGLRLVPRPPRPAVFTGGARALFLIAAAAYLAVGLWYATRLRVSGDEPHYLLMAQSLWREGDLDLADNLAREDWRENTPGPVAPHYGAPRADGRPFPAHSPGLPFVLAPAYAAGGRLACVALLALAGAGVTVVASRLAAAQSGDPLGALTGWLAALGPPVSFYSFHVYTEVPSALAAAGSLLLLLGAPSIATAAAAALLASALPWLHLKMTAAAAALGLIAALRLRGVPRMVFLAVAAAAGAGYLAYYDAIFGTASPLAIYGGLPVMERGSPLRALAGLLIDRSYGLLWHAPVFLLALAALPDTWRARAWPHALLAAAILAPVLWWRMWWGGQCPPARFLVPAIPLLACGVALRVGAAPARGLARWRCALAATGLAIAVFAAAQPGELLLLNRGDRPTRLWTALSLETDLNRYLPSLVANDGTEDRVAAIWVSALAFLLALDRAARRDARVDRLFAGTALPIVVLLAAGAAVDHWARAGQADAGAVRQGGG